MALSYQIPKPRLAFEKEYWAKAEGKFIDYLIGQGIKRKDDLDDILRDASTPEQVQTSIESSKEVGDASYGKIASLVMDKMHIFIKMGNVAFAGGPESIGLIWTGFKFIFAGIKSEYDTCHLLADACAIVLGMMIECRVYGGMFASSMNAADDETGSIGKIQECITNAYFNLLTFSYTSQKYFKRSGIFRKARAIVASPVAKFQLVVDSITATEKDLRKWARIASDKRAADGQTTILENESQLLEMAERQYRENADSMEKLTQALAEISGKIDDVKSMIESKLTAKSPLQIAKEEATKNLGKLQPLVLSGEIHGDSVRAPGTCQWIFKRPEYEKWIQDDRGILWLYGAPGVGKTSLLLSVLDDLNDRYSTTNDCIIEHFVCQFGGSETQKAIRVVASMLFGLYTWIRDYKGLDEIREANETFNRALKPGENKTSKNLTSSQDVALTFSQMFDIYEGLVGISGLKIFLCIDGLEQCDDPSGDENLGPKLAELLENKKASVNVLLSSRQRADFDAVIDKGGISPIKVNVDCNNDDIQLVLREKLDKFTSWTREERNTALKAVTDIAKGLFRYVPQAIAFLEQPFERPLENHLKFLPDSLDDSYQQEFMRTDPAYMKLLEVALTWTTLAGDDVTVDEVMDAFSGTFTQGIQGDVEDVPTCVDDSQLKKAGGSFLTFTKSKAAVGSTKDAIYDAPRPQQLFVRIRDEEIAKYFLKGKPHVSAEVHIDGSNLCSHCHKRLKGPKQWYVDPVIGHISIAKTCLLHLTSPLFQKKFLLDTPEKKEGDVTTKAEPDKATSNEHPTSNDATNVSASHEGSAPVSKDDSSGDTLTQTAATNSSKGDLGASLSPAGSSSRDPILENANQEPEPAEQGSSSAPAKEGNPNEEQDKTTTEEDQDDAASSNSEDALEMEERRLFWQKEDLETPAEEEESVRLRYEITNWIYHLQQAEKLLPTEDRSKLNEIWDLVEKFLFTSEDVMEAWHKKVQDYSSKPLHLAVEAGLTGLVDRLIKRGKKIMEEDDDGNIPLGLVPDDAGPDLLALLLDGEEKSDPNYESKEKAMTAVSPFTRILNSNPTPETIKILLSHGANPYFRNALGWCPIHYFAAFGSDVEILKLLLDYKGADINIRGGDDDDTPLHLLLGCQQDANIELLNEFLDHGADVTIDNKLSQQPLTFVALHGNLDAVTSLLEHKADALDDDSEGRNALHNASLGGHLEVVKKLVDWVDDKTALLSVADKGGRTAFYYACQNESPDVAEYLLTILSDLNVKDINKASNSRKAPLRKAAFRGHTKVVKKLLQMPDVLAAINEANDRSKQTALHSAAYRGHTSIIEMLLKAGADTTLKDIDGRTPLQKCYQNWGRIDSNAPEAALALLIEHDPKAAAHDQGLLSLAASKGSVLIVKKLLDGGADVSGVDEYGWTPLQVATQFGREDIVGLLEESIAEKGNKPSKWLPPANGDVIQLNQDGLSLKYISDNELNDVGFTLTDYPIPLGIEKYYYEITIKADSSKPKLTVAIGICTKPIKLISQRLPGWFWFEPGGLTWAFHGDDGKLYGSPSVCGVPFTTDGFGHGDTIGCGWDVKEGRVFFTRNGKNLGDAFSNVRGRLFPAVGLQEKATVTANFGSNPFTWVPANDRNAKW